MQQKELCLLVKSRQNNGDKSGGAEQAACDDHETGAPTQPDEVLTKPHQHAPHAASHRGNPLPARRKKNV